MLRVRENVVPGDSRGRRVGLSRQVREDLDGQFMVVMELVTTDQKFFLFGLFWGVGRSW
jgi:hypothetical protein